VVGYPDGHEGQPSCAVPVLEFQEQLDKAVSAGPYLAPEIGAFGKQHHIGLAYQQGEQALEGRQGRARVLAVQGHPAPSPQQFPDNRLPKQLRLGDIVQRRRQGHADEGDVLPALVLGADDGRPRDRKVLQASDLQVKVAPEGLPAQPAAQAVEVGGKGMAHSW